MSTPMREQYKAIIPLFSKVWRQSNSVFVIGLCLSFQFHAHCSIWLSQLDPFYMEWGTPVQWGKFLLLCVPQSVKTNETNPTRPGSPTPCKQALSVISQTQFLSLSSLAFYRTLQPPLSFANLCDTHVASRCNDKEPQQNKVNTWNSFNWYSRKIIQYPNYEEKSCLIQVKL